MVFLYLDPGSGSMIVTLYFKRMKDNVSGLFGRKKEGESDDN
jgi:hypothetical protein